jgi:hypothetical protein
MDSAMSNRSPDGAQRNPGFILLIAAPDFAIARQGRAMASSRLQATAS